MSDFDNLLQKLITKLRAERIVSPDVRLSKSYYYASLPLAVVDAVFSINARYESVANSVHRLAVRAKWEVYRAPGTAYLPRNQQHTMSELLSEYRKVQDPTEIFGNRAYANPKAKDRTSKADVVKLVATVLVRNRIETFDDFAAFENPNSLDAQLEALPGMKSGIAIDYLRMLCGEEHGVKADRHIHSFIGAASGTSTAVSNDEAVRLVQVGARLLAADEGLSHLTPRLLDHAIWRVQRGNPKSRQNRPSANLNSRPGSDSSFGLAAVESPPKPMNEFWELCREGGDTESGLTYRIDQQDRLHIQSPRAQNKNYRIHRKTVERYLEEVGVPLFRRDHSWFCSVYDHITGFSLGQMPGTFPAACRSNQAHQDPAGSSTTRGPS